MSAITAAATDFDIEIQSITDSKPPVSASKIGTLVKIALKYPKQYKNIVHSVEKFIGRCPPEYKLSGLYVIDAIVKAAAKHKGESEAYVKRFGEKLDGLFQNLFQSNEKDKMKMKRVLAIWKKNQLFDTEMIDNIDQAFFHDIANVEESTSPKGSPPRHDSHSFGNSSKDPRFRSDSSSKSSSSSLPPPVSTAVPAQQSLLPANPADTLALLNSLTSLAHNQPATSTLPIPPSSTPSSILPQNTLNRMVNSTPSNIMPSLPTPSVDQNVLSQLGKLISNINPSSIQSALSATISTSAPAVNTFQQPQVPLPIGHNPRKNDKDYFDPNRDRDSIPPRNDHHAPHSRRSPPPDRIRRTSKPNSDYENPDPMNPGPAEVEQGEPFCVRFRDDSLPPNTFKVMSRTLYIGGVHGGIILEKLRQLFETVGRVSTVQINYNKLNAFVKMYTRKEAETARVNLNLSVMEDMSTIKVGWGCGFGPKKCFDYETGTSLIPIHGLDNQEQIWIRTSQRGGGPIEPGVVMEEPDVTIGPKHDSVTGTPQPLDPSRHLPPPGKMMRGGFGGRGRGRGRGDFRPHYHNQHPHHQQQPQGQHHHQQHPSFRGRGDFRPRMPGLGRDRFPSNDPHGPPSANTPTSASSHFPWKHPSNAHSSPTHAEASMMTSFQGNGQYGNHQMYGHESNNPISSSVSHYAEQQTQEQAYQEFKNDRHQPQQYNQDQHQHQETQKQQQLQEEYYDANRYGAYNDGQQETNPTWDHMDPEQQKQWQEYYQQLQAYQETNDAQTSMKRAPDFYQEGHEEEDPYLKRQKL